MPRIEDWSIITKESNPFVSPECQRLAIHGIIYEDSRAEDGMFITTSTIQEFDLKNKKVRTKNSEYILGKVSDEYIKWLNDKGMTSEQFINK